MDITVFLGAPGSGKGTQAKRLAETGRFTHLSTGDMLRAAIQNSRPVGLRAKVYMDRGELVPDEVMIDLIAEALKPLSSVSQVILDGFPRTVPQAQALDSSQTTKVDRAIYFKVPESVLISRLTGRRICKKCGEPYHVLFVPPKRESICDRCGGELIQRPDDSESVVKRRLEVFTAQNSSLLGYYSERGILNELDADLPVDSIQDELLRMLK